MRGPSLKSLKPALAGLVVDHEVGLKEVYSTFTSLVLQGYISQGPRKSNVFELIQNKSKKSLSSYESLVLSALVQECRCLPKKSGASMQFPSFHFQVSTKNTKDVLKRLHVEGEFKREVLKEAETLGLYKPSFPELISDLLSSDLQSLATSNKKARIYLIAYILVILASVVRVLIGDLQFDSKPSSLQSIDINYWNAFWVFFTLSLLGFILYSIFLFVRVLKENASRKKSYSMSEQLLTQNGEILRKRYRELLVFLKEHPLKEARWSNEYLPYAIAFGLYKDYEKLPK